MTKYGTWNPYSGAEAIHLAIMLLVIAGALAFWGSRLQYSIEFERPGKTIRILLVGIWTLSLVSFSMAAYTYYQALVSQIGAFTPPNSPVSPITFLSGLASFVLIAYLSRSYGWKVALGSAVVGTIAAPMIFELPFDLIVMWRTYPPTPTVLYTLLYFLPLFVVEISSFAFLTFSPLTRVSKYTLFSLAGMFLVFAVWAGFGFSYPANLTSMAFNGISKVLSFVAAVTLFLPHEEILVLLA